MALLPFEELDRNSSTIGEGDTDYRIETQDEARQATQFLTQNAHNQLIIYSPELNHELYSNDDFADSLLSFIHRNDRSQVQILLHNPNPAIKMGHRLVSLCQNHSGSIQVRRLEGYRSELSKPFILADQTAMLIKDQHNLPQGILKLNAMIEAKEMNQRFMHAWEASLPEPEFRRLHI